MIYDFTLSWGDGIRIHVHNAENVPESIVVTAGNGSYVSGASMELGGIQCHVLIGRYSSIGRRVVFEVGLNHDYNCVTTYPFEDIAIDDSINVNHFDGVNKNQIIIGNDVWIGGNVIVLPGITIGSGSVIGAGSVVTKDIPSNVIAVGNPARVLREITKEDEIKWKSLRDEYYKEKKRFEEFGI